MPSGKYAGMSFEDIPSSYLGWAAEEWSAPAVRAACWHEPLRRATEQCGTAQRTRWRRTGSTVRHPLAGDVIEAGYRQLAKRLHPDAGGTTREMQALNECVSELRQVVER